MQEIKEISIDDVSGLKKELHDLYDRMISISKQQKTLMEAMKLMMEAVNLLKEEVQDGGQRPIKEQ